METKYKVYNKKTDSIWYDYSIDSICDKLKDKFVVGYWIGDDSFEWLMDNTNYNYYFINEQNTIKSKKRKMLVLFCNSTDAMAFKLRWI